MDGFASFLRNFGVVRLGIMGIVAVAVLGFISFAAMRFGQPGMSLLYSGLDLDESGRIVAKLDEMKVPYELQQNGTAIYVPDRDVLRIRVQMAEQGLPTGGSLGYELFDRTDTLGTTSFVQNVNLVRALEGELARTIRQIDRVKGARVHLVLPKREVFARKDRKPSASIVLKLQGGITPTQVQAIQNLVAAAVPELTTDRVSIVDSRGNLLTKGLEGDGLSAMANRLTEIRINHENRLKSAIEQLLGRTVGINNVRAEVTVDLDQSRIVTNAEEYNPDGQVVRSTQTVEESSEEIDGGPANVSVEQNLPGEQAQNGPGSQSKSARTEETTNFEITKTVRNTTREAGAIKRISVAVVVNGSYVTDKDGKRTYQPRSEKEIEALTALVRSAIGYDAERGDTVEVVNLQFAELNTDSDAFAAPPGVILGLSKTDIFKIAEMVVFGIVAILVLLLVVRPLLTKAMTIGLESSPALAHAGAGEGAIALTGPDGTPAIAGPGGEGGEMGQLAAPDEESAESMIDVAQIEGRVKASSMKKIADLVDKHPEEAVNIMRNWLYDDQ